MTWLIKSITLAVFCGWAWVVYRMIRLGRSTDAIESIYPTQHELFAPAVYGMTAVMVATAATSHVLIRGQIGGASGLLFAIHLPAAMTFVFALYLMRRYPGIVRPELHRKIAHRVLIPSFIITAFTGPVLVVLM